jgi:hypothetical protein
LLDQNRISNRYHRSGMGRQARGLFGDLYIHKFGGGSSGEAVISVTVHRDVGDSLSRRLPLSPAASRVSPWPRQIGTELLLPSRANAWQHGAGQSIPPPLREVSSNYPNQL